MRILRTSCYLDMFSAPLTIVVRDCDVVDTLESLAITGARPGVLHVHDIFTMGKGPIEVATAQAMRRIEEQKERNMAILFHWTIAQSRFLRSGGTVMMDKPAPLDVVDIQYVFEQIKQEPSYRDFTIQAFAHNGTLVTLANGAINDQG